MSEIDLKNALDLNFDEPLVCAFHIFNMGLLKY
jgi:hypothetical protein